MLGCVIWMYKLRYFVIDLFATLSESVKSVKMATDIPPALLMNYLIYDPLAEERERVGPAEERQGNLAKIMDAKKMIIAHLKKEMFDPLLTSYSFNLTPPYNSGSGQPRPRLVIVKIYAANSLFYLGNPNPMKELSLTTTQVAAFLERGKPDLYKRLKRALGDVTEFWGTLTMFSEMRGNIAYTTHVEEYSTVSKKKPYHILVDRCADIQFVTDTGRYYVDVFNQKLKDKMLMAVVEDPAASEGKKIAGLCRGDMVTVAAENIKDENDILLFKVFKLDRLLVLAQGMGICKELCRRLADECIDVGIEMIEIHSIQTPAHVCYLKGFISPEGFSHASILLTDAFVKVYSILDKGTVDAWIIGNNRQIPREDTQHARLGANAAIELFDGDEALEKYSRTLLFQERFGHQVDLMEVLCESTPGVSETVDNFLGRGANRRVFIIHSAAEYNTHVDNQMKPLADDA